ncbi:MAG: peptide-methionine (S)-S-oxide reductase MsrA [Lactococcus hircilactis]
MIEKAVFAGGCFWCMVEPFEERKGIISVVSGYTGGFVEDPTYDQVSGKYTGHTEAVEILFDSDLITYETLLELYWDLIDPTDVQGQIYDRGDNYRPVIFVENDEQRKKAIASKNKLEASKIWNAPIVVPIEDAQAFWPAEEYHQDFYLKNPKRAQAMHKARKRYLTLKKWRAKWPF